MPRKYLKSHYTEATGKKGTIDQYFKSESCVKCECRTVTGLCESCFPTTEQARQFLRDQEICITEKYENTCTVSFPPDTNLFYFPKWNTLQFILTLIHIVLYSGMSPVLWWSWDDLYEYGLSSEAPLSPLRAGLSNEVTEYSETKSENQYCWLGMVNCELFLYVFYTYESQVILLILFFNFLKNFS